MLVRSRGFTLLEMMVTITILGIIMALALPSFLPVVHKSQLYGAGESVAALAGRARMRAVGERRCFRLRVEPATNTATRATELVIERFNTFHCDEPPGFSFKIEGSTSPDFIEVSRMALDPVGVTVQFRRPGGAILPAQQAVWRPTGWLLMPDGADLNDDDVEIVITHNTLVSTQAGTDSTRSVLLDGHGSICAKAVGEGVGANPSCF